MVSSYEKILLNRKRGRCRSPPQRKFTTASSCSPTTSMHQHSTFSKETTSSSSYVSFLSLLKEHSADGGGGRGELYHVFNPNHSNSKMW